MLARVTREVVTARGGRATLRNRAGVPEWPKGAGCKPAGSAFRGSNPLPCMMQRFDVLVVGAGPAGSAPAIHLARAGKSVLLADRARFPLDKPCGGGLTGRALK